MRLRFLLLLGVSFAFAYGHAAPSAAASLGFACITHHNAGDCAIGEAQLRVDVSDPGSGKVDFTFHNEGPEASAITHVYWDDDSLLLWSGVLQTPGVKFESGASPGNVVGANSVFPKFQATRGLTADANSLRKGVDPGEILIVRLKLGKYSTFADVLHDLADGSLRIALQVKGFDSCGAESFVNTPPPTVPIPEPGTFALVASGMLLLGVARRRSGTS